MSKISRKIFALLLAVMMVLSLAACGNKAEGNPGDKNLTVTVVHGDGSSKEIKVSTDAENLRDALEPEGIIAGDESEFGLFVKTVDGETADDAQQQWWAVTKDGTAAETGVDGIVIADGESYEFTLKTGY